MRVLHNLLSGMNAVSSILINQQYMLNKVSLNGNKFLKGYMLVS